jgi:UDP-N-acetylglucosamine diphosphorylase/glucosamine-1-phosphate N-acetyltransferase
MKSERAKVLHHIVGNPMITYVMKTAQELAGAGVVVVVGHQAEEVERVVSEQFQAIFALQDRQLGTGHAVACALPNLPAGTRHVLILYGDVPMLSAATLEKFLAGHLHGKRDLSILGVEMKDPSGYGRLILDSKGGVCRIVEEADADEEQRQLRLINTGIYCVRTNFLASALARLNAGNAQGELYLTDIVAIAYRAGKTIGMLRHDNPDELCGINTLAELAAAEAIIRQGARFKS